MIDYAKFYTYDELEYQLKRFAEEYPELVSLTSLAQTDEGREIYLVTLTDRVQSADTDKKPGYYIQASIHSSEPAGGTVALHFMETLLTTRPDILKQIVFYIVPRVNPDGVEGNLVYNAGTRSKNATDPRRRENVIHMKDMDGDGLTLTMRIRNPLGDYKEEVPGVMVRRKPGEMEGEFYDLYEEGEVINYNGSALDYDHRMYDFNRCFPVNWTPNVSSSEYPFRFTENRAIAEFLITHPNIFAGLDYHNGQNGILRSPTQPDSTMNKQDLKLTVEIGQIASDIIGFPLVSSYNYGAEPHMLPGCTNDFAYGVLGISHYTVELGNGYNDLGYSTPEFFNYLKKQGMDTLNAALKEYSEKEGYKIVHEFKPFRHPQLGDVEIGGMQRLRAYYQNPKVLLDIVPKTTEFMLKHAAMGPRLVTDCCECINVGGDIYRIRAQVKNLGRMGTTVMKGTGSYNAVYPVHISLKHSEEVQILSRPNVYEIPQLDSMESTYVEWFVKAPETASLELVTEHPKAGVISAVIK